MPEPAPIPVLEYTPAPEIRWQEDGDDLVLSLPSHSRGETIAQWAYAMSASTLFAIVSVGFVWGVTNEGTRQGAGQIVLYLAGLVGVGQWILVTLRLVRSSIAPGVPATVRVTPTTLIVQDAIGIEPGEVYSWQRAEVAGLRLDLQQVGVRATTMVRMQVTNTRNEVRMVKLPWVLAEPTQPHETRLRAAIGLPPREVK